MPFKTDKQRRAVFAKKAARGPSKRRQPLTGRVVHGHRLKALGGNAYEFEAHGSDFHVRKEGGRWILDEFDSRIKDADAAHIDSTDYDSLQDAVAAAFGDDAELGWKAQQAKNLAAYHAANPKPVGFDGHRMLAAYKGDSVIYSRRALKSALVKSTPGWKKLTKEERNQHMEAAIRFVEDEIGWTASKTIREGW